MIFASEMGVMAITLGSSFRKSCTLFSSKSFTLLHSKASTVRCVPRSWKTPIAGDFFVLSDCFAIRQKRAGIFINLTLLASFMVILVRYGEIALKGKNRPFFEKQLVKNIRFFNPEIRVERKVGRIIVHTEKTLDLGNSGTSTRLLLGILAGQPFETHLTGDSSLSSRPMRRVTKPLRQMGATISGPDDANYVPLHIKGGNLKGLHWKNEIASAQVKSAILLAGLYAEGETSVEEPVLSRDHTERLFGTFKAPFKKLNSKFIIQKTQKLSAIEFRVPGDISSAAFFIAATLIIPNSDLIVRQVGLNPTRIGFLKAIESMGADIKIELSKNQGEPIGDIRIKASRLKAIKLNRNWIPSLIDELPILMILCALAEGTSVIEGAEELRVKETDRIRSMAIGLNSIGGKIEEREDGCVIKGVKEFVGGTIFSFSDHRTAMSFLTAGLRSKKGIIVEDTDCIQTSYPEFWADLKGLSKK